MQRILMLAASTTPRRRLELRCVRRTRRRRRLPALHRHAHQPPQGRHSVARIIFHGNRGELCQPYREGQEDQLAALGFALNVLVLWNTQYMDDAVSHLRRNGREINDEHLARLSPLQHEHVLMLVGTFPFTLPANSLLASVDS